MYTGFDEVLKEQVNPFFCISVKDGDYECGNKESYYAKKFPDETFSYDVSNCKVLANMNEFGTLKSVTFYRNSYSCDDIPGVWIAKDFGQEGPFFYRIKIGNECIDLKDYKGSVQSDLMNNLFPRVKFELDKITATLLAFAPISADGRERLRGLVYGLYISNKTKEDLDVSVFPPDFSPGNNYFTITNASGKVLENVTEGREISIKINSKGSAWVPTVIYGPGDNKDVNIIENKGTLYWFNQTLSYFKNMLGNLSMDTDPLTAAIFERAVYQGISSVGMNREGEVVGSNWGTFPTTKQIWMKDMFYSYLPLSVLDPEFFLKGCLWFLDNGIRPEGSKYKGGIYHSLSNSLISVIMVGMYYDSTGDKEFFKSNKVIYNKLNKILEETLQLKPDDCWLFPSLWISDALSLGKYHTGSNICVWKAFNGISRIAGEVFEDDNLQCKYKEIAMHIKVDIEKYMVIEGKFGPQYLEGIGGLTQELQKTYPVEEYNKEFINQAMVFLPDVIKDGYINLVMHDGEESDTTLIPFYKYKSYDDGVVRNYAKFTTSQENPTYGTECRGIKWGNESGATFPGYTTAFAGIVDSETMNGDRGYMRELKRLVDIDGSWWWWPYKCNTKTGDVVRLNCCGKCGWASGVFASMFMTQILGIQYDAPSKQLNFRPFSPCSNFVWQNARTGSGKFDFSYQENIDMISVSVTNRGKEAVTAVIEIISDRIPIKSDTQAKIPYTKGKFLGKNTIIVTTELRPSMMCEIIA
ncbi:MAG: hypothetical protein PHF63_03555 [Herbinix sp.]|nr:hypothetical protein [Herbinix sp.]